MSSQLPVPPSSSSTVLVSSSVPLKRLRLILQREEEHQDKVVSESEPNLAQLVQQLQEKRVHHSLLTSSELTQIDSRLNSSDNETQATVAQLLIDVVSNNIELFVKKSSSNATMLLRLLLRLLTRMDSEVEDLINPSMRTKLVSKFISAVVVERNERTVVGEEESSENVHLMLQLCAQCLIKSDDKDQRQQLQRLIEENLLLSSSPRIRISAMKLISELGLVTLSKHLERFSSSSEPRERLAAFDTLLQLHNHHKLKLTLNMYHGFQKALNDDFDLVRCAALKLVFVLSQASPNLIVHGSKSNSKRAKRSRLTHNNEGVRLVDDAFGKISNGVNDLDLGVRALAVQLMGDMRNVSPSFLEQTLDKKLMSNLRVKRSAHQRTATLVSSGEWSSGKQFADDAPRGEVEASSVSLMSMGACGALIHGLEDEFLRVRTLAVEALTKLSLREPKLATLALDFLVDMFNDEIELVRLKAIQSLRQIGSHISLHLHQLETILSALDDFNIVVRQRLHGMLQTCKIAAKDGLERVVVRLLENLKRYPQDYRSIMLTFKKLGTHHPNLTLPLVTHLLELHPFFDTPEMDVEDPAYICILVLVANARQYCPTMEALLDQHVVRHFQFLTNAFPHLVPKPSLTSNPDAMDEGSTKIFLLSCLSRVEQCETQSPNRIKLRLRTLERAAFDLKRLLDIEPQIAGLAEFAALYVTAQSLTLRIVQSRFWQHSLVHNESEGERSAVAMSLLSQLEPVCLNLSYRFHGLSSHVSFLVRCLDLFVTCLTLLRSVQAQDWRLALTEAEYVLQKLENLDGSTNMKSSFVSALRQKLSSPETVTGLKEASNKPAFLGALIKGFIELYPPESLHPSLCSDMDIKIVRATIYEPAGNNETPLKYTAGMVLAVPLDAELFNVEQRELVRVAIRTPDQSLQLVTPKASHFLSQEDEDDKNDKDEDKETNVTRLLTNALMSHSVWSEAMSVEVSLVLDLRHNIKLTKMLNRAALKDAETVKENEQSNERGILHLCEPVKVHVLPKGVKKGI